MEERHMNIYVTADANWAIGKGDELLVRIPREQKNFIEETAGKVVVMGRKTFETIYKGLPIQGRTNIVMSRDAKLKIKGASVVHSVEELLAQLEQYPTDDVNIIGGESVFRQLLPYCQVVHVTKLDETYAADKYFPALDKASQWRLTADSDEQTYFDIAYEFLRYEKVE